MKRVLVFAAAALACSSASKYKAPTPLATIALPTGDKLKPYDPAKPGLARPFGMADFNGTPGAENDLCAPNPGSGCLDNGAVHAANALHGRLLSVHQDRQLVE